MLGMCMEQAADPDRPRSGEVNSGGPRRTTLVRRWFTSLFAFADSTFRNHSLTPSQAALLTLDQLETFVMDSSTRLALRRDQSQDLNRKDEGIAASPPATTHPEMPS